MDFKPVSPHFGKTMFERTKHIVQIKSKFVDTVWGLEWKVIPTKTDSVKINEQTYERYRVVRIIKMNIGITTNYTYM